MNRKSPLYILSFLIVLLLLSASPAFADPGDGDGSGGGQNKSIALTLLHAVPSDESLDVPRDVTIELYFNKNICNVKVLDHNSRCFHLTSDDGEVIPCTLILPDDQVQRTYKREAFLKPEKDLAPNTRYRIAVDRTLMAKNGNYIDNAHTAEFVTGSSYGAEVPEEIAELGDLGVQTIQVAFPETEYSVPLAQDQLLDADEGGLSIRTISILAVCAIAVLLLLTGILAARRKRTPRSDDVN